MAKWLVAFYAREIIDPNKGTISSAAEIEHKEVTADSSLEAMRLIRQEYGPRFHLIERVDKIRS